MTLREKRCLITSLIPRLIDFVISQGLEIAIDDAKARDGHMRNSLHYLGLAVDFNLYRGGVYLTKTEDHRLAGEYWKTLHPLCRWGGDWGDGNHYSVEHGGRK